MFDTHFDLLTKLYISYKRNDFTYIEKFIKNFNYENIKGLIANLCFMSKEEMSKEYDINYYKDGDSVIDIFRISTELLRKYIPKDIVCLTSIEGCDYLNDENDLIILKKLGLNAILPVWNCQNKFGSGNRSFNGLTPMGERLINKAVELGIGIDLSHANEKTFWDIIKLVNECKKKGLNPIIYASHSNVYELCDIDRNLKDEQLKAIRDLNGFIGVASVSGFVVNGGYIQREKRKETDDYYKYIEYLKYKYIKHIMYVKEEIGNCVAVSTDNMSFIELPDYEECPIFDYSIINNELRNLLSEYYRDDEIEEIMFDNANRVLSKIYTKKTERVMH